MKIKLILSADFKDPLRKQNPFMPLSLSLLAAAAPEHDYDFTDMLWDDHVQDKNGAYDLVGISVRMSGQKVAFQLADAYRQQGTRVVLGGPQASANPMESIMHADAVVIGEGESLWPLLLADLENDRLNHFYVSAPYAFEASGYKIFQLEQLPDLRHIPFPARHIFRRKYTFDMVFAARGCPIGCDFCSVTRLFGRSYRFRPVEEVVREIGSIKGYYYLIDDTVFGRPSTFNYYGELYDRLASQPKIKFWTGQANLDAASHPEGRKIIQKAVKAGFVYAAIGMESINKEVLKKSGSYAKMGFNKEEDVIEKMKKNIRFIQDEGILISAWFAIGYEEDDIDAYYRTFEFCKQMHIMPVFTPVHALQGTDLYDRLDQAGSLQNRETNLTNVQHATMDNEQIMKAMEYVVRKGYSLPANLRRSWVYFSKLRNRKTESWGQLIHKTIFAFMTQQKMKKITMRENYLLRRKISR